MIMDHIKQLAATIALSIFLFACGGAEPQGQGKATGSDSTRAMEGTTVAGDEVAYACPMHPEVTGMKGDSCPKCGMDLVEVE